MAKICAKKRQLTSPDIAIFFFDKVKDVDANVVEVAIWSILTEFYSRGASNLDIKHINHTLDDHNKFAKELIAKFITNDYWKDTK